MLAQRADKVIRKFISFIDISADLADKSFLSLCFRLWFYIFLIVGIGHRIEIVHHAGLRHTADEHSMCAKINVLFHLQ